MIPHPEGSNILAGCVQKLFAAVAEDPSPQPLWILNYTKIVPRDYFSTSETRSNSPATPSSDPENSIFKQQSRVIILQDLGPEIALEDSMLHEVEAAWEKIVGVEGKGEGFMVFDDRGDAEDYDGNDNVVDGDGF